MRPPLAAVGDFLAVCEAEFGRVEITAGRIPTMLKFLTGPLLCMHEKGNAECRR